MLENIRSKPEHIKKSISLVLTIVIFSIILFVWISSWDARMSKEETHIKAVSPVAGIIAMFDGLVSGFKQKIASEPVPIGMSEVTENIQPATTTVSVATTTIATATSTDTSNTPSITVRGVSTSSIKVVPTTATDSLVL